MRWMCSVRAALPPPSVTGGADATSARPGGSQPGMVVMVALGVPSADAWEGETIPRGWSTA